MDRNMDGEKYVCIKDLTTFNNHVAFKKGSIYRKFNGGFIGYYFINEFTYKENFAYDDKESDYLITLAEYRQKQIDEILNG